MARAGPSRSIGPLPGGSKFFRVITGFKSLAPGIRSGLGPNPLPMELPGTGATDEQCLAAKESRLQHGPPGVSQRSCSPAAALHHSGVGPED